MVVDRNRGRVFRRIKYRMNCRIAAIGFVDIHFPAKLPQRVNSQIYSGANVFRMCRIRGYGWSFNKSLEQRFVFLTMRFGKRIKLIAIQGASHAGHSSGEIWHLFGNSQFSGLAVYSAQSFTSNRHLEGNFFQLANH